MADSTLGEVASLLDDTIVAISTPAGRGAIGIVRVSGAAASIDAVLEPLIGDGLHRLSGGRLRLVALHTPDGLRDRCLAVRFRAPASYTGEDVVELQMHGNPVLLRAVVDALQAVGARAARPGEFTRRAVTNGRLSLLDAEGIDALIHAPSRAAARLAGRHLGGELRTRLQGWREQLVTLAVALEAVVDFPDDVDEDEVSADLARLGPLRDAMSHLAQSVDAGQRTVRAARVVFSGPVNAGKSTLFNALLGYERAIVSPVAGTTRDLVGEQVEWDGLAIRLEDTAGLRPTDDAIEAAGIRRTEQAAADADLVVAVRDGREVSGPPEPRTIAVATRGDLLDSEQRGALGRAGWLVVGLGVADGLLAVQEAISRSCVGRDTGELLLHTARQAEALEAAAEALSEALRAGPAEVVLAAVSVRRAGRALDELVGAWPEGRVLDELFSRFCIGK